MRRIGTSLLGVALVALYLACSADAPAPTPPGGGPGPNPTPGTSPLTVRLFTNNANPVAGTCTLIQAIVSLNGSNVPDGTGVAFSADFGVFQQSGTPTVSVVTQGGAAVTAVCSTSPGLVIVRATASVGNVTGSGTIQISFQPSAQAAPFVTSCSPNLGANTGGTTLTINGGRFFGDASTTRVTFTVGGITREGLVTNVTATSVVVTTPAFPEAVAPTVPVTVNVTLGKNTANPFVLTIPNCFVYGTAAGGTATITAILPSSGSKAGNTRVTIVGSGFAAPLQVFFGTQEANVLSVSYNQIIALTPQLLAPAAAGPVEVRVHEVNSGQDAVLADGYRYVQPIAVTSANNSQQRVDAPFSPVTIFGSGFEAPVAVSLAGIPAAIMSVSATEIVVMPSVPFVSDCKDVSGPIQVVNINTGEGATGPDFRYLVEQAGPVLGGAFPFQATAGQVVTVSGFNLGSLTTLTVGGRSVVFTFNATSGTIQFTMPDFTNGTPPKCGTNPVATSLPVGSPLDITVKSAFGCTATSSAAVQPMAACVP